MYDQRNTLSAEVDGQQPERTGCAGNGVVWGLILVAPFWAAVAWLVLA